MAEDLPYCSTNVDAAKAADETVSRRLDPAPHLEAIPRERDGGGARSMPNFRVETTREAATMSGLFGGSPDVFETAVPGVSRYFIDETEVTFAEFERRYREAGGGREPLAGGGSTASRPESPRHR